MAREKGQAEVEAGQSMRSWGWMARKKTDATICPACGSVVIPGGPPGTWDFPGVGVLLKLPNMVSIVDAAYSEQIDVEVKAGTTSLAFSRLEPDQRLWAEETEKIKDRPKYLWICLGKNIRSKDYPRKTYLIPYDAFLGMEEGLLASGRKSIPYGYEELAPYELMWAGKGFWVVPTSHPIKQHYHISGGNL